VGQHLDRQGRVSGLSGPGSGLHDRQDRLADWFHEDGKVVSVVGIGRLAERAVSHAALRGEVRG